MFLMLTFLVSLVSPVRAELLFQSGFEALDPLTFAVPTPSSDEVLPANVLPSIGVSLSQGSVDPARWRIRIDGVDQIAASQVTPTSVRFTPVLPLSEGLHQVEVSLGGTPLVWSFATRTVPTITNLTPFDDIGGDLPRPTIGADFSDIGAGVDPSRIRLLLDGADVTSAATSTASNIRFMPTTDLSDIEHVVRLSVFDLADNESVHEWTFRSGPEPTVMFQTPTADLFPFGATPEARATFSVSRGAIDSSSIRLFLDNVDVTGEATVVMDTATSGSISFVPSAPLATGAHQMHLEVAAASGALGFAVRSFDVDQQRTYALDVVSPAANSTALGPETTVIARASSSLGAPRVVSINGIAASQAEAAAGEFRYQRTITLQPGANSIVIEATFPDGAQRLQTLPLTFAPAPVLTITAPVDLAILGPVAGAPGALPGDARDLTGSVQRAVAVTGTSTAPIQSVQINQQAAQVTPDGLGFVFPVFFLHEGTNLISAVATDIHGRSASAQITVYVDQTAPILTVESPAPDQTTSQQTIDIRGLVNDAVEGRVGASTPIVRITNTANAETREAVAAHLGFLAKAVPLEVGRNELQITARDSLGNERTRTVTVSRIAVGARRVLMVSGNGQSANTGAQLEQPLIVQAVDSAGDPLPNLPIQFDVVRGSGTMVSSTQPPTTARHLVVQTNEEGFAQVLFQPGVDVRPGSDAVRARALDMVEDVVFIASASPNEAVRLGIFGSSGTQYVATASTPVEALMVQALDTHGNPVEDTPVNFEVIEGDARFESNSSPGGVVSDQGRAVTSTTDQHGVAAVRPTMGGTPGRVRIGASLPGVAPTVRSPPFQLDVLAASAGATDMSGVVMYHNGTPIEGVRLSIDRTPLSVLSDESGYFRFDDQVPAGKIDLFVDGRSVRFTRGTANFEYPALHFETAVVAGQENQLPHPVYLPPVETSRSMIVGGDEDVVLSIPGQEGFEMRVFANSVTFPDGSRTGPLVVSAVHADRLPMVPPGTAGQFAGMGWTIQPTNTRFDPPIEVRMANTTGLARGRTVPIFQWDHDLAAFLPMGQGTVGEDGAQIVSDPGTGISKAGWGGGGPPPPPDNTGCGSAPQCTECEEPGTDANGCAICVPREPSSRGAPKMCLAPKCRFDSIDVKCVAEIGVAKTYNAILPPEGPDDPPNKPDEITWSVGQNGSPTSGTGAQFTVTLGVAGTITQFQETIAAVCAVMPAHARTSKWMRRAVVRRWSR
ncbi:MAG: hypothetical protein IPK97_06955 [Ahniella sp.]|nr:hypothetical protein [Ahniella sp.]